MATTALRSTISRERSGSRRAPSTPHIGGKEDLLVELALAGAEAFHAALDAVPDDGPPLDRLRDSLRAHLSVVSIQLDVATVWLHEWRHLNGEARARFMTERRRYEDRVRRLFQEAATAGALRDGVDVKQATLVFLSVANWAYTWMTEGHRHRCGRG